MKLREKQAARTKRKIYETSLKLFQEKGYANVTIKDIAVESKVAVGSFYNYFSTKSDIITEEFKEGDAVFENFFNNELKGDTLKIRIKNYMLFYIDFILSKPFDFIKEIYVSDNKLFVKKGRKMQTLLIGTVEEAISNNEINTKLSSEEYIDYLYTLMRGLIYNWVVCDKAFDLKDLATRYLNEIVH